MSVGELQALLIIAWPYNVKERESVCEIEIEIEIEGRERRKRGSASERE